MKIFARTSSQKRSSSPRKKGGRRWRWLLAIFLVIIPALIVVGVLSTYAVWAQTFDLKRLGTMPERNTVFDVDGKIYSRLAGANRLKVSLKEVLPSSSRATASRSAGATSAGNSSRRWSRSGSSAS